MFVAVNGDSISIGDKLTFAAVVKTGGCFTATRSAFAARKLSFLQLTTIANLQSSAKPTTPDNEASSLLFLQLQKLEADLSLQS